MIKTAILSVILLSAGLALAEEKPLFHCQSAVMGFTNFTIFQNSEVTDVATDNKLNLRDDVPMSESWTQYGSAQQAWAGFPIFESQFEKKNEVPGLPPHRIYVSINPNGKGAISVMGGLDPILCEKLF